MNGRLSVVVCDDDDERAQDWAERIRVAAGDAVDVSALPSEQFGGAVAALKERKARAKQDHSGVPVDDMAAVFDGADVLLLDSDLTPDADSAHGENPPDLVQQHLVGELGGEVAHLARCYSSAGALVVVNQKWKRRSFDLTLKAFESDVAEVYVSETDIDNPGLWSVPPGASDVFRPWSWPVLSALPALLDGLEEEVTLDSDVLATIGLSSEPVLRSFTDRQLDVLGVDEWQEMTFDTFAHESNFGLRLKEETDERHRLRLAVCGVRRWLDRHVLPSHNILIDLPHLLQRRPWTVEPRDDMDAWNNSAAWFTTPDGDPHAAAPTVDPAPDAYAATASRWLGRHTWLWPEVAQEPLSADRRVRATDPVFCEDVSAFVDPADATDFISDLEGPSGQRFVRSLDDVDYHPRRRLLT